MFNDIRDAYIQIRRQSELICQPLNTEDYIPQPALFTSPMRWQLAHTTWFFEEMVLKPFASNYSQYDPRFSYLFNSYYNHVGERTPRHQRGNITRPSVSEVYHYRKQVDAAMLQLLEHHKEEALISRVVLGLNHEQQHQELMFTDLKYTLAQNPILPVYKENFDLTLSYNVEQGWQKVEEGVYTIGYAGKGFCFDNELALHKVYIQPFEISKSLVTNGEYLEFIESGGYKNFSLWLDEGWAWVIDNKVEHPLYWQKKNQNWFVYTLSGLKALNTEAQLCHVNFYEASAFASWKGLRLPTELEWEVASDNLTWGTRWEWTNSAYLPYPGFAIAEGALGEYNGKFMVNQMVLRGASLATAEGHSRKTYRNFFHPHFQWQFSGIRLAK